MPVHIRPQTITTESIFYEHPPFWASSDRDKPFVCWQWSNHSREEARQRAEQKSRELTARWDKGENLDRYAYGNGAIREEIIQTIADDSGESTAVITRNVYGSLILNAKQAMFIDIDFQPAPPRGLLGGFFSKRVDKPDVEQPALDKLNALAAQHRDLGMRVYRTFARLWTCTIG